MNEKPTYEELARGVRDLEQVERDLTRAAEALSKSERLLTEDLPRERASHNIAAQAPMSLT